MGGESGEELTRRIAELERENRALRQLGAGASHGPAIATAEPASRKLRTWPWTLLAVVLIVVGGLLAPLGIVAAWAKVELTDTDRFVAALAPLAKDPAIQGFVADEAANAVDEHIDVRQMTSEIIDGVTALGTGPLATKALESMKGPAAVGIQNLMHGTIDKFVGSDAFADAWRESLRVSHRQFAGVMQNDPNSALQVGQDGSLGIELSPVISAVKNALVGQGIDFARQIPDVNRTIVVARSDALPKIQLAYGLAVAAGSWLPWVSLGFLAAGVLVARRKAVALMWAAVALALVMALTLTALAVGKVVFISSVSPSPVPAGVADPMFTAVVGLLQTLCVALLALALAVAVVTWFAGPFRTPRSLRGHFEAGVQRLRAVAERNGISTGRTGEWLHHQRLLLRIAVAVGASLAILLIRPLTAGVIMWTLVIAVGVVLLLELIQRPTAAASSAPDAEPRLPVA